MTWELIIEKILYIPCDMAVNKTESMFSWSLYVAFLEENISPKALDALKLSS